MKNIIVLCALVFSGVDCVAQIEEWEVGLGLFPHYSNDFIAGDRYRECIDTNIWKPSMSVNVFAEYKLSDKSIFGFGLGYQNHGERSIKTGAYIGYGTPEDLLTRTHIKYRYNHHNIELPFYYKRMYDETLFAIVGISGVINVANRNTVVSYFSDRPREVSIIENDKEFRRLNATGSFGLGADFLKKEKLTCFVASYIQVGLLSVYNSSWNKRKALSIGVSTGVRI